MTRILLVICIIINICNTTLFKLSQFEIFKNKYGKKYSSLEDELIRFNIFTANLEEIKNLKGFDKHAIFDINYFSDFTQKEFKMFHNTTINNHIINKNIHNVPNIKNMVKKFDWRLHGISTNIIKSIDTNHNFMASIIGNIEGILSSNKKNTCEYYGDNTMSYIPQTNCQHNEQLSIQQLISCYNGNNNDIAKVYEWLINNNINIVTESKFPYDHNGAKCIDFDNGVNICNYTMIDQNENIMANYIVKNGPISASVDASLWQHYNSGIITKCTSTTLDHSILIIGFDDIFNPPYWIIKNSWGSNWGENGYIRIMKGIGCSLIHTYPSSALLC